jgi:pyruvate/2-oxoglutarate dehydrogenase complex dihydrolipoamide dehydrogenase (E3) component
MLAGTAVYVNAGTQLAAIDSLRGIVSAPILLSLVLLGLFPLVARKGLDALQARRVYAGWTRPKRFESNLVVIGGGSAGLVTAYIAAAVKAKVTLVEQHALGGDCLNTGCVPSKALIRAARVLADLKRADEFGIRTGPAEVDFAAVMQRVQQVITAIEPHDSAQRYTGLGVDVVMGRARIATPWQVDITAADGTVQSRTTRAIVIAAGARPFVPPIPGIASVEPLTSDSIWSLRERPERLLVLGGGPIGCELGQAFARLGSRVTLLEQAPRLLAREDDDVAQAVADGLAADGVDLRLGHTALRFVRDGNGKRLIAGQGSAEVAIGFDTLLVAVGRAARLEGYGLEELGIATGRTVEVDGFLRTRFPNIHAAGDVAGPWQFTHAAAHQAWYAAVNALFAPFKTFAVDARVMPAATFTTPEVARVGLNRREAAERGTAVEVTRYGLDDLDRALIDGEAHGWVEVLTAPGKDRILGVTIVGAQAAELLAEYVLAMKHGIGLNKLLGTIHAYPTLAEANKYAAGVWKKAHAPQQLLAWVERFHAWRRG